MTGKILGKTYTISQICLLGLMLLLSAAGYAAEDECTKSFYADITAELSAAYDKLGKPEVNFDNLGIVKDMAVNRLESRVSTWPKGATFSISVLSDYISVATFCHGNTSKGEWAPKK
ncbi:MAG: hypothetical protein GC149_15700 [Gammaproteobacteria bacterium]|nr:hypothetical protein [Gammaproteobacteria bacterium]